MIEKDIIIDYVNPHIEHNNYKVEIAPNEFVNVKDVVIENRQLKQELEDYKSRNEKALLNILEKVNND